MEKFVALHVHVKKFHVDINKNKRKGKDTEQIYFYCEMCPSIFTQDVDLKNHLKKFHTDKRIKGAEVNFKFVREDYDILRDQGEQTNFEENYVRCKKCASIFRKDVELANHVKKFHPDNYGLYYFQNIL